MFTRRADRELAAVAATTAARYAQLLRFRQEALAFDGFEPAAVPKMQVQAIADERVFLCTRGVGLIAPGIPEPIDQGEFVVTNTRAVFMGTKQARRWAWTNLVVVEHSRVAPKTEIVVANRSRTFGVLYGREHQDQIRFSIDLAVAVASDSRDRIVRRIDGALDAFRTARGTGDVHPVGV